MEDNMSTTIYKLTTFLILFAAINFGLIGAFGIDIVTKLLGDTVLTKLVYVLMGVSALLHIVVPHPKALKI
jgi:uncharacterized membrane protein YuzA (DUF378 family)